MIRTLAEPLSRGKYFTRCLPAEFGKTPLFVSPDAQLKYLKPGTDGFDKDLLSMTLENIKEGDIVWDIGSNVGVFAFAAASVVSPTGHVLAVEPDIWLANLLQKSSRLPSNKNISVDVLPAAISDSYGLENFLVAGRGRATNMLEKAGGRSQMGGYREKNLVPTCSLDDLLNISEKPDFIKIDVEGAEVNVLRGAERILSETRPVIYCEIGTEHQKEITEIFKTENYRIFDSSLPKELRFKEEKFGFNILAYPSEKLIQNASGMLQVVCEKNKIEA